MTGLPAVFTGGWVRRGISLGDQPPAEDSVVWWLQAEARHADLRVPTAAAGPLTGFAGTTAWDGRALTWTRTVDLEHFAGADVGTVEWDGADLLESGTFEDAGGTTTYTERWVRLPGSEGPLWSLRRGEVHLVRAGDYAITLVDRRPSGGAFLATAWHRAEAGWRIHHTLPDVSPAPSPPWSEDDCGDWSADD